MKKLFYLIILALILGLVLAGCTFLSNIGQVPTSEQSGMSYLTKNGPPSVNLVGLWHFDEGVGDIAYDSSGHDNDGTVYGANWVDGKFDNALSFDGVDDYVDCGDISTANWANLTTEAWVYWDGSTVNGYAGVYFKAYHNDIGRLLINGAGKILVQNGNGNFYSNSGVVPVNQWCHIVYVYDQSAGMEYIYVNGDKEGEQIRSGNIAQNSTDFWIGYGWFGPANYVFSGLIDEVRIWNKALSGDDIGYSYSLGAIEFNKELTDVFLTPELEPDEDDWVVWVMGGIPQVSIDTGVTFTMLIAVNNKSSLTLKDAWVKDRLGAELEVVPHVVAIGEDPEDPFDETIGEATYDTKGNSDKVFIDWDLDNLLITEGGTLIIVAKTDINPGGGKKTHQEYTSSGEYELNSGATMTFYVTIADEDISLVVTTDELWVEAVGVESD